MSAGHDGAGEVVTAAAGHPAAHGSAGACAAPHALATEAGSGVLRRGGSAVDAAIAMNAVLCVAYPHMAGLGGDGFWLVWDPSDGAVSGINASGPAAALASPDFYRERGFERVPERGPLAALTVPGAVDGWRLAHERWGRLPWGELLAAAIDLARGGVPVAASLARYAGRDRDVLLVHRAAARLYAGAAGDGAGSIFQPELARSLEGLARLGARAGFYEGALGEEIARALAEAGSPLRAGDLAAYRAEWVEPLRGSYRGLELLELPPNTQGIAALEILRLLEGYDLAAWGDDSADYIHAVVEATKLAFADRDAWVTDPRFVEAPLGRLASVEYAEERRGLLALNRALRPEQVTAGIPFEPRASRAASASSDSGSDSDSGTPSRGDGDTCYFCAVDAAGLAVSCIQSLYFAFGSMVVGGTTGILLQDRGTSFSLDPADANRLEARKRPRHTLIPAMLLRDGRPCLLFGTMGGEGQPQTQAALVTRIVDFGYDARRAVDAPRWLYGRTWGQATQALALEGRIPDAVARELERRGHDVRRLGPWDETMGHAQVLLRRADDAWEGAADPRGDGAAESI